jgi:hypothetical protein
VGRDSRSPVGNSPRRAPSYGRGRRDSRSPVGNGKRRYYSSSRSRSRSPPVPAKRGRVDR